jgi:hypothetical protein
MTWSVVWAVRLLQLRMRNVPLDLKSIVCLLTSMNIDNITVFIGLLLKRNL